MTNSSQPRPPHEEKQSIVRETFESLNPECIKTISSHFDHDTSDSPLYVSHYDPYQNAPITNTSTQCETTPITDKKGNISSPTLLFIVAYVFCGLGLMGLLYSIPNRAYGMTVPCLGLLASGMGAFYEGRKKLKKNQAKGRARNQVTSTKDTITLVIVIAFVAFLTLVFVNAFFLLR